MELSIIIPNWNTKSLLDKCLESIFEHTIEVHFEVIVIDDCSSDGSPDMVREKYPEVILLENSKNLWFTKTSNLGIRKSQGKYLLLLNSDTVIHSNAFKIMVSFLDENPEAGAIGPRILNPDGSDQLVSLRRFPSLSSEVFEKSILAMLFPGNRFTRRYRFIDADRSKRQVAESLSGACLMIRREVIQQIGFLEERYLRDFDDMDLCYRVRKVGWSIYYLPEARIIHYGGKSFEQRITEADINSQLSEILFFRKFFPQFQVIILKIFRFIDTILKTLLWLAYGMATFRNLNKSIQKARRNLQILRVILKG
ncbi:glycosyltransferase family 2 protein [bacterium]|nr:glycosyltransferase family 2 protein [bacterium]